MAKASTSTYPPAWFDHARKVHDRDPWGYGSASIPMELIKLIVDNPRMVYFEYVTDGGNFNYAWRVMNGDDTIRIDFVLNPND